MSKIEFVPAGSVEFRRTAEMYERSEAEQIEYYGAVPSKELPRAEQEAVEGGVYVSGAEGGPQLFELRMPPGLEVQPHAHAEAEIIVVLEGELRFGNRKMPAGSAISVPAYTLYGFRTGPEGARFINFRGKIDFSHILKDEFLEQQRLARQAGA